uniref:uncharacterized protein LOC122610232 n=1 Tax=Erigeron canadensis TaxID=72917 RepID=UPI001CB98AC9|nr:uncharacterized protein LOC122610232 [Erigeron canadensis]
MAFSSSFSSSSLSTTRQAVRSISLPTRSHPSTLQVEEELTSFRTWETSFSCSIRDDEKVFSGLTSLDRLYTCVDNLLDLPLTQQALFRREHEKLVDELCDQSMRLLDICGSVRDAVSLVKEHVRDVQSAIRRGKDDFIVDGSFLKKLMKDAKRGVADLKLIDHTYISNGSNLDPHITSVFKVLSEVSEVSISVFGMLMSFLSATTISKQKSATKWSRVSKFIHKATAGSKDNQPQICIDVLEHSIESIENALDSMFRRLIRTRSALLNIISQ